MVREAVTVASRIDHVTVYATGARVRRVATIAPVDGALPARVRITGLPDGVVEASIRVEVDGPAVVTTVRTGVSTGSTADASDEESRELRAARRRIALAEAELERLSAELERLAAVSVIEDDPSDEPPASWSAVVGARRALVATRADRQRIVRDQLTSARAEHADATRAFEVAIERDHAATTACGAKLHELRTHVELDVAPTGGAATVALRLEYAVRAARWAPSYVARLDAKDTRFELRAVVAQATGEDWRGVALRLSTAEPAQFAALPELAAQKIGRRQAEPPIRGFRAPPTGAEALYADYDRSFPRKPSRARRITAVDEFGDSTYEGRAPSAPELAPAPPTSTPAELDLEEASFGKERWDDDSSRARPLAGMPAPSSIVARKRGRQEITGAFAQSAAMADAKDQSVARSKSALAPGGRAGGIGAIERSEPPAPVRRLDYASLRMPDPKAHERGRLVPAPIASDVELDARAHAAAEAIARLALPPGCRDSWPHTYDYAFASDGQLDVASDAAWHSLALTARTGTATLRHVAVPREQADVFRVAVLNNPLGGPLLPGPIDIYDRGQFVLTSAVDYTPPGGTVEVGLGVDPTVKIARNVEFHEEVTGMLRGGLRLVHAVTIEVDNLAARSIELEVRERVPVTRDGEDDIEVALGKVEPAWERWTPDADAPSAARLRGGYRWKVAVPATTKQRLRASYEIKIAGKLELVGGNRREP